MNGNDMLEFEERYWQRLAEQFIEKNREDWDAFVMDIYNQEQSQIDELMNLEKEK